MPGVQVYKRATWRYRFEAAPVGGKRRRVEKSGFRTKKEALVAGTKAYNEYLNVGRTFVPSEISVADYLDEWLDLKQTQIKQSSIKNYSYMIERYVKPALGNYRLKSITAADIQRLITDMFNSGVSRSTISATRSVMVQAFSHAVEPLNYISVAPIQGVRLPSKRVKPPVPTREKPRRALTLDEWHTIISRFPEKSNSHLPLMFGFHTGMREGEVLGLTWDDIDLEHATLYVRKQSRGYNLDERYITDPKFDSFRQIEIGDTLFQLILREKERQDKLKEMLGDDYPRYYQAADGTIVRTTTDTELDFVVRRKDGRCCSRHIIKYTSEVIHHKLNLPTFDYHTLRHTHATMLVEADTSPKPTAVQARLGHRNIQTTLKYYTHLTDTMREQLRDIVNDVF